MLPNTWQPIHILVLKSEIWEILHITLLFLLLRFVNKWVVSLTPAPFFFSRIFISPPPFYFLLILESHLIALLMARLLYLKYSPILDDWSQGYSKY